ncbi:MAG: ammonium transporter, partial [Nitrospirae bacterium CG18_big_fil_WC_8_21_14_2_50_70_55]
MAPLLAYGLLLAWLLAPALARAEEPLTVETVQTHANYLWTLIAAFLVFFMQAGFAMVE